MSGCTTRPCTRWGLPDLLCTTIQSAPAGNKTGRPDRLCKTTQFGRGYTVWSGPADRHGMWLHTCRDYMNWGQPNKLHYALRTAGAIGYIALAGLDRVTVTTLGNNRAENFPPHRGKHSSTALFSFLETFLASNSPTHMQSSSQTSLAPAINSYAVRAKNPGPLIIISDLFEPLSKSSNQSNYLAAINLLARKGFEVNLLHILSPDEVKPNLSGDLKLIDIESGMEVEITADYDLLQRYNNGLIDWQAELRSFCRARSMNYIPVETILPLEELLFSWMRQYSVLR